ncbi:restriction endonuclease subunit S [Campylobacter upsaliensis]
MLKNQNSTQADSINGGLEGNALSPRLVKLEIEFKQNGGLWREFKLGELFEVSSSKKIFHANQITIYNDEIPNSYPYVVRSTRNNGVRGYLCENKKYLNPANTLSFAQDTFSVFYQEKPYFTGNKVKVLTPKFKPFTKIHALFFASIYQKVLETFTWGVGSTEDDIKDIVISLPVLPTACHTERSEREVSQNIESKKDFSPTAQNDKNTKSNAEAVEMRKQGKAAVSLVNATQGYQIAFNYMESYIKELEAERIQELEAERIQELEAYLKVTGLNDYTLSQKEQEALKAFENLSTPKRERERERE